MIILKTFRLSGLAKESIVDGLGLRYVVFAQGCSHKCMGCHNPQTHNYFAGEEYTVMTVFQDIKRNPLLKGVTFSGGEPMDQSQAFLELAKLVKDIGLDIWCFTGYTLEEILESKDQYKIELVKYIDVLVDGKFIKDKKTIEKPFVGSSNQRIIDIKASMNGIVSEINYRSPQEITLL